MVGHAAHEYKAASFDGNNAKIGFFLERNASGNVIAQIDMTTVNFTNDQSSPNPSYSNMTISAILSNEATISLFVSDAHFFVVYFKFVGC